GLGSLIAHDGGLTFLGSRGGGDSSSIAMFTVGTHDGEARWTEYLIPDDYDGPHARLGTNGERELYVSEEHQPWFNYERGHPILLRHARSVVSAYSDNGWTLWRSDTDWPGLDGLRTTDPVAQH